MCGRTSSSLGSTSAPMDRIEKRGASIACQEGDGWESAERMRSYDFLRHTVAPRTWQQSLRVSPIRCRNVRNSSRSCAVCCSSSDGKWR